MNDLRDRVVLVRWWTAPACPFCEASSAALNTWHHRYADDGLTVVGIYHHKLSAPLSEGAVAKYAAKLGFEFPIAIDREWRTLNEWWLNAEPRSWTSVSFLIDRRGRIRYVHPGGSYEEGQADYDQLVNHIETLLAEYKTTP